MIHPFSDGNKRIGSFLFVDFLNRNGRLFHGGEAVINDVGLAALALLVAESAPKDKDVLKETFEAAHLSAEIEVYSGAHGWCPPDSRVYNEALAEKAWGRLLALYAKALA